MSDEVKRYRLPLLSEAPIPDDAEPLPQPVRWYVLASDYDRLRDEVSDLRAFVAAVKKPVLQAAKLYGITRPADEVTDAR